MSLTEKIIEIVQKHSILYDSNHPEYKIIRKKDKVWEEIGFELQENSDDLKKKWRNLRDTYAKYLRSIKTRTGQAAKKNYKNWQWAKHMEFFRPFLAFTQTVSNINEDEIDFPTQVTKREQETGISDREDSSEEQAYSSQASTDHQLIINTLLNTQPSTSSTMTRKSTPRTKSHQNLRGQQKFEEDKTNSSSVDAVINYFENKNKRKRYDNKTPNDHIFAGYAQTVNSFSLKRQSITRIKIAQIIAKEELKHLEEMESISRPSSDASDYVATELHNPTDIPNSL